MFDSQNIFCNFATDSSSYKWGTSKEGKSINYNYIKGQYWTSTLDDNNSPSPYILNVQSPMSDTKLSTGNRFKGITVRPVLEQ